MFLAIGLASRRGCAAPLATLQGNLFNSLCSLCVNSRTGRHLAHMRPGFQCMLTQCTWTHAQPCYLSCGSPVSRWDAGVAGALYCGPPPPPRRAPPECKTQRRNAHQPRSQMRARGSILAPANSDSGWLRKLPPSPKALATQLPGVQGSTGLRRPFSALPGSSLTCPPLGGPFSLPGSLSSRPRCGWAPGVGHLFRWVIILM